MANIGELIDISKPENYQTEEGTRVKSIKYDPDGCLAVSLEDGGHTFYTNDGFYWQDKSSNEKNLIKINTEIKKRKIVDVAVAPRNDHCIGCIYALSDDGKLYSAPMQDKLAWHEAPELPQD